MSMFSSLGIAKLPYLPWLLPVLAAFLSIHLFMLYRDASRNGYMPFGLSLTGSAALLASRTLLPGEQWILVVGVLFITSGSLLNAFFKLRFTQINHHL